MGKKTILSRIEDLSKSASPHAKKVRATPEARGLTQVKRGAIVVDTGDVVDDEDPEATAPEAADPTAADTKATDIKAKVR